jgi:hypothetical protein
VISLVCSWDRNVMIYTLELILSSETGTGLCNSDGRDNYVCREAKFGDRAFLCRIGECRCPGGQIFANENQTRCCE